MADTYVSTVALARIQLGVLGPPADAWMTDAQILEQVLGHCVFTRQDAWQFIYIGQEDGLGRWIWSVHLNSGWNALMGAGYAGVTAGLNRYTYLYGISFTGAAGCTYTINASGSIVQTAGTLDTTATYTVSGTPVNFNLIMRDLLNTMATRAAQTMDEQIGGRSGESGTDVYDKINQMAAVWQGVNSA